MKIDKKLNLVLEIEQDTGRTTQVMKDGKPVLDKGEPVMEPVMVKLYSHSTPVEETTFERYGLLLGEVMAKVYGKGFGVGMSGRLALLLVKQLAAEEGPDYVADVQSGLINEIDRLTSIIALDPVAGWGPMPISIALKNEIISDREYKEVISNAVFFTAVSWLQTPKEQKSYVFPMMRIYNAQIVSLTATDFSNSLRMSTSAASTSESAAAATSSVLV